MSIENEASQNGVIDTEVDQLITARIGNHDPSFESPVQKYKIYSQLGAHERTLEEGDSSYDPNHKYPKWIYLYHIKEKRNQLRIESYKYQDSSRIDLKEFRNIMERAYSKFHSGWGLPGLERIEEPNFETMHWGKRCYIALIIEKDKWRFPESQKNYNPIQIVVQDELDYTYYDNNSFFDGGVFDVGSNGQVCYVVNQQKKPAHYNPNSSKKRDEFRFDFFLLKKLYDKAKKQGQEKILIIDPPGDNDGPPWGDD